MHIAVSSLDQFISHVILHTGQLFEVIRDFGLMLPDIFHVLVTFFELGLLAERQDIPFVNFFYKKETIVAVVFTILMSLFGRSL